MCILGKGPERGGFHISNYVVCLQSCDGGRGGCIQSGDFPILYFVLLAINVLPFIHTLKVSDYHAKVSDLWLLYLCA